MSYSLKAFTLICLILSLVSTSTTAQPIKLTGSEIEVEGKFVSGKLTKKTLKNCAKPILSCKLKKDKDISGAICMPDGRCFVVSDEARFTQAFKFSNGNIIAGARHYLLDTDEIEERRRNSSELDLEALARFEDTLFAIGSHSNKRKRCGVAPSRHQIFAFGPESNSTNSRKPVKSIRFSLDSAFNGDTANKDIQRALNKSLQANGLNIEGAAVFESRLYLGFRAPYGDQEASIGYVMSMDAKAAAGGKISGVRVHPLKFESDGTGIRAMEPVNNGLLLLTGNAGASGGKAGKSCENASPHLFHSPQIYFWNGTNLPPKLIATLANPPGSNGSSAKAEALMLNPQQNSGNGTLSVIVFFDSIKNGKPHRYEIPTGLLK